MATAARHVLRAAGIVTSLLSLLACTPPSPVENMKTVSDPRTESRQVPGEVIVQFRPGTTPQQAREIIAGAGGRIEKNLGTPELYLIRALDNASADALITHLRGHPQVRHAEPNRLIRLRPPPGS